MNNAIYRKTMKKLKNRINVKLVNIKNEYLKCISKSNYMSHKIFNINLVQKHKSKLVLKLNKPAYIVMCSLELSELLMYKFYYDYIKNKYSNNSILLFTDTDNLMYEIKTEGVYEDFSSDKEMFDFSIYSTKSKYYDS